MFISSGFFLMLLRLTASTTTINIILRPRHDETPVEDLSCKLSPDKIMKIILKPKNLNETYSKNFFQCGVDENIDAHKLVAEWNSQAIFKFLKSKDSTPEYQTKVQDVIKFDNSGQPVMGMKEEDEDGVYSLFIAPHSTKCDSQTLDRAVNMEEGFYPVFIGASNNFSDPQNKFLNEIKCLEKNYGADKPSLCSTKLPMSHLTATSRIKTLHNIYNFPYNNGRNVNMNKIMQCKSETETKEAIAESNIFDIKPDCHFKESNQTALESEGFAKAIIERKTSGIKSIIMAKTIFSSEDGSANESDIVPFDNFVVFDTNEKYSEVYITIKADNVKENNETFNLILQPFIVSRRKKRMTTNPKTIKITIIDSFWKTLGYCDDDKYPCEDGKVCHKTKKTCQDCDDHDENKHCPNKKVCDAGSCVQCTANENCEGGQVCHTQDKTCQDCKSNDDNLKCANTKVCDKGKCVDPCHDLTKPCTGGMVCHTTEKTCQPCDKNDAAKMCTDLQLCQQGKCKQKHCKDDNHKQCHTRTINNVINAETCEGYSLAPKDYGPCDTNGFSYDGKDNSCTLSSTDPAATKCFQGHCQVCNEDEHCKYLPDTPACNTNQVSGRGCKMCTNTNKDKCEEPTPNCDGDKFICQICGSDKDCIGKTDDVTKTEICRKSKEDNKCVQCLQKSHCKGNQFKKQCHEGTDECVECTKEEVGYSNDCQQLKGEGRQVCNGNRECVECMDGWTNGCKKATPKCFNQRCVECLDREDCKVNNPGCNNRICGQCQGWEDCRKWSFETCMGGTCGSTIRCESFWWAGGSEPALKIMVENELGVATDRVHFHSNWDLATGAVSDPKSNKCLLVMAAGGHNNGYPAHLRSIVEICKTNLLNGDQWNAGPIGSTSFFPNAPGVPVKRTGWFFYETALDNCFYN